jgi:phenylpropionate dioxygenase-like ring-hydroxylating dioxygenase large terminal subunit
MIHDGAVHAVDQSPRTLDQHFYTDDTLYQREMTWMRENMWFLVGQESRIPQPGDYFLYDFDKDNIIVVRDQSGEIRAHHNVCTHRGSRLCKETTGSAKVISCPYHAWSFDLNGALRAAPFVSSGFDKSQWGLAGCHVRVFHGFVFLSFADIAPDFDEYIGYADREFELQDAGGVKIVKRLSWTVDANWKIVVENNLECYHCKSSHPNYCAAHPGVPLGKADEFEARDKWMRSVLENSSHEKARMFVPVAPGHTFRFMGRSVIGTNCATESIGGKALAPLMGQCAFEGVQTFLAPSALATLVLNPDHIVTYNFVPRSARRTDVEVLWLVNGSAKEGLDYDLDHLTEVWLATLVEDKVLVENVQLGVESTAYKPGPIIESEKFVLAFNRWYRDSMLNGPNQRTSNTPARNSIPKGRRTSASPV